MYQTGDLIVYENMGVCSVQDVSTRNLPGADKDQLYYTLKPLYQECSVHTPVDSTKTFMRPIISKEEANRLIDTIPTIQVEPFHSKLISGLTEHYTEALSSHACEDMIALTLSIYAKKLEAEEQKRKFSTIDERFMKRTEELLFGELAAALGILKEEVPNYIASKVGSAHSGWENAPPC